MLNNINPEYFKKLAQIESNNNPNANAKTSSAAGLYQFTKGTWNNIVKELDLDYTEDDRYDPEKSKIVIEKFTEDNRKYLESRLGRTINDGELYLAHFLGRKGAKDLLNTIDADVNLPINETVSEGALNANKSIFLNEDGSPKGTFDILNWANDKMGIENNKSSIDNQVILDAPLPIEEQQTLINENEINGLSQDIIDNLDFNFNSLSNFLPSEQNIPKDNSTPEPEFNNDFAYTENISAFNNGGNLDQECGGPGQPPCIEKDNTNVKNFKILNDITEISEHRKQKNKDLLIENFKGDDTRDFFDYLKQVKSDKDYNKFVRTHNKNGNPRIITTSLNDRAFYHPLFNTMVLNNKADERAYIEELAHSKQSNDGVAINLVDILSKLTGSEDHYNNPKSKEFEAHEIISPKLHQEVGRSASKEDLLLSNITLEELNNMHHHWRTEKSMNLKRGLEREGMFSLKELDKPLGNKRIIEALEEYKRLNKIVLPENQELNLGGQVNSITKDQILNEFNEGGKHEDNPYGGIPIGRNSQGGLNLVEEGETQYNDYIFSNHLKVDSSHIKDMNLPEEYLDLTFAEASKKIKDQIEERPFDKLAVNTANGFFDRLIYANEKSRINTENMKKKKDKKFILGGQEDLQFQQYSPQDNQIAEQTKDAVGQAIPYAGLFRGIEKMGVGIAESQSEKNGTISQSLFDPLGGAAKVANHEEMGNNKALKTVGSFLLPGLGGTLLNSANEKREAKVDSNNALLGRTLYDSDFHKGGGLHRHGTDGYRDENGNLYPYSKGNHGPYDLKATGDGDGVPDMFDTRLTRKLFDIDMSRPSLDVSGLNLPDLEFNGSNNNTNKSNTPSNKRSLLNTLSNNPLGVTGVDNNLNTSLLQDKIANTTPTDATVNTTNSNDSNFKFDSSNLNGLLRATPVIGNLAQLLKKENPEVESLDRLDNRYQKDLFDEQTLLNSIRNTTGTTRRAILEASAGNTGAARSNLLASQINEAKAIGEAFLRGEDINRNENTKEQNFNRQTDQFNIGQSNNEKVMNAQNRAAVQNQKQALLNAVLEDVGNIGRENQFNDIFKKTTGYSISGNHVTRETGGFLSGLYNGMQDQERIDLENLIKDNYGY